MAISATMVKELRERTGAGMMECKKALVETDGNIESAIENLRKSGQAKADKKAGRTAAEGSIVIKTSDDGKTAALVEINCETDFVAKDENFAQFADSVVKRVLSDRPADIEVLHGMKTDDGSTTIEDARKALIAKIGENISVRRFEIVEASDNLGLYLHGVRIGVAVAMKGGNSDLAKDIAMHVAASRPICVSEADVPAGVIEKEREIFTAQAKESGKPDEIISKMVDGRVKKFLKEVTLLGQPFVKDPDQTVEQLLKAASASIEKMIRIEVGEGIEKKQDNFADEVMAQVKGG